MLLTVICAAVHEQTTSTRPVLGLVPLTQAKFWISRAGLFLGSAGSVVMTTTVELAEYTPMLVSTPWTNTLYAELAVRFVIR